MANGMPSANNTGMGELFRRLRFVLIALVIYRIGTHIPVPGIDPAQLSALFDQNQGTILGLAINHSLRQELDLRMLDTI